MAVNSDVIKLLHIVVLNPPRCSSVPKSALHVEKIIKVFKKQYIMYCANRKTFMLVAQGLDTTIWLSFHLTLNFVHLQKVG